MLLSIIQSINLYYCYY